MESYSKYYTRFVRPPFAPIYTPTAEEFADPIAYVAKIRHKAEPYGVIKIVPPENFKPPLAIDLKNFEFTPRSQRLNEIDVVIRERLIFNDRLGQFWALKNRTIESPIVEGKHLNLHKLHRLVVEAGGLDAVEKKGWSSIAKKMNVKAGAKLQSIYKDVLYPFVISFEVLAEAAANCPKNSTSQTMQGGNRKSGRMMAGGVATRSSPRKPIKEPTTKKAVSQIVCMLCGLGDNEEQLLLCDSEDCDNCCHTFCCIPKLDKVPKDDWKCINCIAVQVAKLQQTFGFYDATQSYTIETFKDYADNFKEHYFNTDNIEDISSDVIEKEFWKSVIDETRTVCVKYGADLITSKVGSGFPRKTDDHRGSEAKTRQFYANHAWNLNNLPVLKESVLSHIETDISGMMVPWVYVGMCFSTFCWHTEDHWTYSINYNHLGEKKIWYGIGGQDAERFEKAVSEIAPELTCHQKDIFHQMITAVNPSLLISKGVPVYTVHQNAGEFVITFPRAYHAGYNEGFNLAEAVNFAPIDWLKSGRLAVSEYARVRRTCVFSHDELVMKMVTSCDKLGIAMSLASLDEMTMICEREDKGRKLIKKKGVKKTVFQKFENVHDDNRSCKICNTTMFLSALYCGCEDEKQNITCLEHIDDLCGTCSYSQCTLKYRYTMDELFPYLKKLQQRTTKYFEWADRVERCLDNSTNKPRLTEIEQFIDYARREHFPHTAVLQKLYSIQKQCQVIIDKTYQLLNGKMKTRKETRIQRADTRPDMGGVRELMAEILDLPCEIGALHDQLEDHLVKVEKWCDDVDAATSSSNHSIDELQELKNLGECFEIRTPQMEFLSKKIESQEWHEKVDKILEWKPTADMENNMDFLTQERWNLETVQKWMRDANEIGINYCELAPLVELVKQANKMNSTCEKTLSGSPTVAQIEDLWRQVRMLDWCSADGIDWLRREILQARDFDYKEISSELNLKKVNKVLEKSQKSTILSSTDSHKKLIEMQTKLLKFTQRILSLFKPRNSYYSLVEIISDRDDLAALIEGQAVPRYLDGNCENPTEEWDLLYEFGSSDELKNHLQTLKAQEATLLRTMKTVNASRSLKETCVCGTDKNASEETVSCMVCRCRYHASCCEWNSFFGQLPLGSFLCVRCLRGKRPCIEDVQPPTNAAPANAWEVMLVKNLIEKVRNLSKDALELMKRVPQQLDSFPADLSQKAEQIIEGILGSELVDLTVFNRISKMIPFVFGDLLQSQSKIMAQVRDRPVRAVPLDQLFFSGKKSRKRNTQQHEWKKEKKRKSIKTDDELCSAEQCLRPYGDHIGWIQCGVANCSRWYHYICVGQTVAEAKAIEVYSCFRCKQ